MSKKVAVILAGCGHLDGAEIREAVLALYFLDKHGAETQCFAPDIKQHDVVNHLTGEAVNEERNVLQEAARIARGKIRSLNELNADEFDAVVLPGGYGVAKNLSDLALKGAEAKALPAYEKGLKAFNEAGKPIGAICIAPAVLVAALTKGTVTIGEDKGTAEVIQKLGGKHLNCATNEICIDEEEKIVSTSAYMRDDKLAKIGEGIESLVKKVLALA